MFPADPLAKTHNPDEPRDEVGRWTASADQSGSSPRALRARDMGHDVEISNADGTAEIRSGGTRAWRNNNPGNIRPGQNATDFGAIGSAGGFAVFPDEVTGTRAAALLLQTPRYVPLTLDQAVATWAPPKENNTARYQALVRQWTGLSGTAIMGTMSSDQIATIVGAIRRMEGWQIGAVTRITSP